MNLPDGWASAIYRGEINFFVLNNCFTRQNSSKSIVFKADFDDFSQVFLKINYGLKSASAVT